MPFELFKIMHIAGVLMTIAGLALLAGIRQNQPPTKGQRALVGALHGIGLITVLFAGVAMLLQLGFLPSMPLWVWVKLGVWMFLGASLTLVKKHPQRAPLLLILWILAGGLAAYMALYKVTA